MSDRGSDAGGGRPGGGLPEDDVKTRAESREAFGYEDYGTGHAADVSSARSATPGAEAGGTLSQGDTGKTGETGADRGAVSPAVDATGGVAEAVRQRARDVARGEPDTAG